jgi:hypothetical protein
MAEEKLTFKMKSRFFSSLIYLENSRITHAYCFCFGQHCSLDLCQKQISIADRIHIQKNHDFMHENESLKGLYVGNCSLTWELLNLKVPPIYCI